MSQHAPFDRYAQFLHWSMVAMLLTQWGLAEYAAYLAAQDKPSLQLQTLALHKSFGMTILALLLMRAVWRFIHPRPAWPVDMPHWQRMTANTAHILLYGLIFALPITGWLGSSASAYSVAWFGVFPFPDLIQPDPASKEALYIVHAWLWNALLVLVMLHIAAALKHHFFDRDGVLHSMLRRFGIAVLLTTVCVTAAIIYWSMQSGTQAARLSDNRLTEPGQTLNPPADSADAWDIDYGKSFIRFTGDQAGATFEGEFAQWTANIHIDPAAPEQGFIDVTVDLASVNTRDAERDGLLKDPEFFAIQQFPQARFTSQRMRLAQDKTDKPILLDAVLNMRGHTAPLKFSMSVTQQNDQYELLGEAVIDRLIWQVGTGEWEDISTVGQHVHVVVRVVTR